MLSGQQQPQEGQEDSSRAGLGARIRPAPFACGPQPARVSPGPERGNSPSSGGRTILPSGTIRQNALKTQDAPEASRLRGARERRGRPDLESHSVFDLKAWRELGRGLSSACFCLETKSKSLGQWSQFSFHVFVFLFFFYLFMQSAESRGDFPLCFEIKPSKFVPWVCMYLAEPLCPVLQITERMYLYLMQSPLRGIWVRSF